MMRFLFTLLVFTLFTCGIKGQNLDKIRVVCLDEVDLSQYSGDLSKKELQNQIAALGFRYIEDGQIKYHDELIVYDCKTGTVQFTANFDENRLTQEFVLFESEDVPSKKISFSKEAKSDYVDLNLNYKGQKIAAYPVGKTEIFNAGKLIQTIRFNEGGGLPTVTNYDSNIEKISEGTAAISGYIQDDWSISKLGEWKFFDNGQLASISVFDKKGDEIAEKHFSNGTLQLENRFLGNGSVEVSEFYANGNIKEKGVHKANTKVGTWEYFDSKGDLVEKVDYINGQEARQLIYDNQGNVIEQLELVGNHSELPRSLEKFDVVYQLETFYANGELKSAGYQAEQNKVGVYEYFDKNGSLSEISEYNLEGTKINSVDADIYLSIQEKEKNIFRELLVAKTTNPGNLNLLSDIEILTDKLAINFDSLMMGYNYKKDYIERYSILFGNTSSFGKLSNSLDWYDSLLKNATNFNNEVWAYSHDLYEIELALEKELALQNIAEMKSDLENKYTSSKNTLFGTKTVVMNDQEDIYESITKEIYPSVKVDIKSSEDKYKVQSTVREFSLLLEKGSSVIAQPDEKFKEALKNTKTVQDKKQLFLSAK